jgi:prepilin-type N-terminal cleavage/methylation domain-containing protein
MEKCRDTLAEKYRGGGITMKNIPARGGFSLIELIVVMAVGATLLVVSLPFLIEAFSPRVKTSAECLAEDIRFAQNEAVRQGSATVGGGTFRPRKAFIVFDIADNSYSVWRWEDFNGNNVREAGEFSPDLDPAKLGNPANDAPIRTGRLENGVSFRIHSDVTKRACGGTGTPPANPVSFNDEANPPCNGSPCIRFDGKGFIEGINGAAYLTDDNHAYAISTNRAGILTVCRWDEGAANWVTAH